MRVAFGIRRCAQPRAANVSTADTLGARADAHADQLTVMPAGVELTVNRTLQTPELPRLRPTR
jgi:hypothetical protein